MYVDLAQPPFCSLYFLIQQEDPDIVIKLIVAFGNFPNKPINYFPSRQIETRFLSVPARSLVTTPAEISHINILCTNLSSNNIFFMIGA
jgi:hypothetical protein